jgi:hypothetical protein
MSVEPPGDPVDRTPLTPRARKALLFGPVLAVVALVVTLLGVPWQLVALALAVFVVWLLVEG